LLASGRLVVYGEQAMRSTAYSSTCPITVPGGPWMRAQRMRFAHRTLDAASGV
jgi:hypothetical protein